MHRHVLGLVALLAAALLPPAFAQAQPGISQKVAVCSWSYQNRCINVDANGAVPTTPPAGGAAVTPSTATATDKSGTITLGGTAQTAIAANTSRKGWCIQNPSNATEVLYVRVGATATTTTGVQLAAGQQACNPALVVETALVSVLAATTSHQWYGTEWQ